MSQDQTSTLIARDGVVWVCLLNLDAGTRHLAKEKNIIGQIASTGSPFPLLCDLLLSTANSGSSHRTPDYINIQCRTRIRGFRAHVVYHRI